MGLSVRDTAASDAGPFGPKQIREVFLEEQREHPGQIAMERRAQ